ARSRPVVPGQPGGAAAHAAERHGGGRPHTGGVDAVAGGAVGMIAVTREHQVRARVAGACRAPRAGTRLDRLTAEQLAWVERVGLLTAEEARAVWEAARAAVDVRLGVRGPLPLALLAASGDGYGDGYGYGSGYGSG